MSKMDIEDRYLSVNTIYTGQQCLSMPVPLHRRSLAFEGEHRYMYIGGLIWLYSVWVVWVVWVVSVIVIWVVTS